MKGGLGNQLFQYSAAYALAKEKKDIVLFDVSYYSKQSLRSFKINHLSLDFNECFPNDRLPRFIRSTNNRYINYLLRLFKISTIGNKKEFIALIDVGNITYKKFKTINGKNIYLDGYFLSEGFFAKYRTELLRQIAQNYKLTDKYYSLLNEIKKTDSVAVHIRRGDFLKKGYKKKSHYSLGESYYWRSLSYISSKITKPTFYFFSDDINWAKKTFGEKKEFVFVSLDTEHPDIDEMMLMSNCKHMISANSTFSWWAAWLNKNPNPIILVPKKRYGPKQMVPDRWIRIEV